MRKKLFVFAVIAAAILALPSPALAKPVKWRDAPTITACGTKYRYRDGVAVVEKMANRKEVRIPYSIKINKREYKVKGIWEGSIGSKTRTIYLDANLDTCEDSRMWSKKVKVLVSNESTYRWLKKTGANVRRVK